VAIISLKKLCRCGEIVNYTEKYCKKCSKKVEQKNKESYKEYKRNRKDKKEQAFYISKEWIRVRDKVKDKYKGLCLYSYYILGEIKFVDYVHHIVELKEDWDKRLNIDNLIPCCDSVHKIIHNAYNKSNKHKKYMQEL